MFATPTTRQRAAHRRGARTSPRVVLELADSSAWSVDVGREGVTVRCLSGTVWMTREGDPEDHVLHAPAAFSSSRRGRLALLALGPARVAVEPAGEAARQRSGWISGSPRRAR